MVNMLQRTDDVLAKPGANGTERELIREVEEAVDDLVQLMKTYQNKSRMSKVAGTPFFKQRLKDAEAVVNWAFKKLKSPLAACSSAYINEFIAKNLADDRRARRQRKLDQVEIAEGDVMITNEILGKGGFGTVYLADYLGRNVACKVIPVEHTHGGGLGCHENDETVLAGGRYQARVETRTRKHKLFLQELQMILRVRGAHTVSVYGAMTSNKHRLVLVMELLVGGSLKTLLGSVQPIPDSRRLSIILDICKGMVFLHGRGTVHGDLKSANVLLDGDGRAKIGDFGTSRLAQHATGTGLVSRTTSPAGITYAYAAPEILNGERISNESDVYSLGMVVWEIFHREAPWANLDLKTMLVRVLHEERRPGPCISFGIEPARENLVRSCWAQKPWERPTFSRIEQTLEGPPVLRNRYKNGMSLVW